MPVVGRRGIPPSATPGDPRVPYVDLASMAAATAHLRARGRDRLPRQAKTFQATLDQGLPKPLPGMLAKDTESHRVMANDAQISALYRVMAEASWPGVGFMGYALLSELAQISEFRKPTEILSTDMTRRWLRIKSRSGEDKSKVIAAIEADWRRLDVQTHFRKAFGNDFFFGHGLIHIDVGSSDAELAMPLVPSLKIQRNSLRGLKTVEPLWIYPDQYNALKPLEQDFYAPTSWHVLGQRVHSTRLLSFISRPVPDMLKPSYLFGGVSLTQLMYEYVERWLRNVSSVSDLTHTYSTPVLATDMSMLTQPNGAALLAERGDTFNVGRDNQGIMFIDKNKEEFSNVTVPIAGIDKLQAQSQEQMAAVPSIPLVRFFGIQPAGLNATSQGEVAMHYDNCRAMQEATGTPCAQRLLEITQYSLFGEADPDLYVDWEPLQESTPKEDSEIRKANAEVDCAYIDHQVLTPEEVRQALADSEDSRYAGIDVSDVPEPTEPAPGEEDLGEGEHPSTKPPAGEAARPATLPNAGERREAA